MTVHVTPPPAQKDLHIAPMLDVSKTEFLTFMRILSSRVVLWTEMIVDETIVHTPNLDSYLKFDSALHPIICQIGGRSPVHCGVAVDKVQSYGYQEVNLNIDCPSNRVCLGKIKFGAILMQQVDTATQVIRAMKENATNIPISIKTRVGIDEFDTLDHLIGFIAQMVEAGCFHFVIHARKCILGGLLTPAQNRLVPPLNYPRVYALCHAFPDCTFVLNGGIPGLEAARNLVSTSTAGVECEFDGGKKEQHAVPCTICNAPNGSCTAPPSPHAPLNLVGCMLGRAAMDNPSMFWDVDRYFYGLSSNPCRNRMEVFERYCQYLERTYPRRCCDDDERITRMIPAPDIDLKGVGGCQLCCEFYGESSIPIAPLAGSLDFQKPGAIQKIHSCVIERSLKPIHGIFFGMPKSKTFKRSLDTLSRDGSVRNCGPGYILR
jgi:tRNA-dihydrouridine synthase A